MTEHHPKKSRIRAASRLSAVKVAKLKDPGLYEDGAGLRLVVTPQGGKRWALRLTIDGRRVERGLGVWPTISLDEARRKADIMRRAAKDGRDLRAEQKQQRQKAGATFREAFATFFEVRRQQITNGKPVKQSENTMRDYVFPIIGNRPVSEISAAEVLSVLQPIWFVKPETASRVLTLLPAAQKGGRMAASSEWREVCQGAL